MFLKLVILIIAVLTVTAQQNLAKFGTANQSSYFDVGKGKPVNAVKPPMSNVFSVQDCSLTMTISPGDNANAWWMFSFSFDTAYITDIIIYYREKFAYRMSGFKLYVANTSTIPPNGYLCYEDSGNVTDLPNITQSIPCYHIGQYVIYYDDIGSKEKDGYGPIVELCYVAIHGCPKKFWGSNCSTPCSENCIDQHCYPGNGSCVWGRNCLNSIYNVDTIVCSEGCMENRTGRNCNKYNLATDGLVSLNSNSSEPFSQINDGNFSSCFKIPVLTTWIQIDIKERSTVTEIFLVFKANTTEEGNHTIYASDTNSSWENLIVLKQFEPTETTEIKINAVFRYLFYVPPFSEILLCEIGIVGCPPTQFGPLCTKPCPVNCSGPCHLETGHCTYGCLNGSTGDTCELGCRKTLWGSNCSKHCSKHCIDQHCYPENGSCVWGCNCLGGICYAETSECIDGCNANRTGIDCNKYNLATDGLVSLNSNSSEHSSQVNDGNFSSCFNIMSIHGLKTWLEIDVKERSIVTEIFLVFGAHTTEEGNHTIYASDTNGSLENATVLKQFQLTETTEIKIDATSRYLFYVPPFFKVNLCEIGIVGCPPTQFGPLCTKPCPVNCSGPCHLETGYCTYGCLNGSIGDTCELDSKCYNRVADNNVLTCKPEIYKINPSSGPVNGGTLVTITGRFIGNANDNVSADFDGVRCHNVTVQTPYTNLTCFTGKNSASVTNISVSVHGKKSGSNSLSFRFQTPTIFKFFPKNGIQSGNTTLTITGHNISYEGQNRYNISFYDNTTRIECSTIQSTFNPKKIKCKTGKSDVSRNMSRLQVVIDDLTILTVTETFQYLPDPKFTLSNESRKAQQSGGATFTIRGEGFNNVGEITVDRVGANILNGARSEDYSIQIGLDGTCLVISITMQLITCLPPKSVPRTNRADVDTVHVIVVVGKITAYIGDLQYKEDDNQCSFIVGLLTGGLVTSIIIGITAVLISGRSKKIFIKKYKIEMSKDLSERRENTRNDDELGRIGENEMAYNEINPAAELNSNTNCISHQEVHNGYQEVGPCSPTNPYNRLQQLATDYLFQQNVDWGMNI